MSNMELCVLLDFTRPVLQAIYIQNQNRSVKRCAKIGLPSHDSFIDVHISRKSVRNVECSSSRKTSDQLMRRNISVLPEQCIICKGENILRIHIPRRGSRKSSQFANTHQVSWK